MTSQRFYAAIRGALSKDRGNASSATERGLKMMLLPAA